MKTSEKVYEYMEKQKTASIKEVVENTGINRNTVGYVLSNGVLNGVYRRVEKGKYEIIDPMGEEK